MGGGLLALTFMIPFYLLFYPAHYYMPTASDWGWLLILAGICTVLCFDLQLNALKKISPFTSNIAYNMEPVYGIILAFIVFKENKLLDIHFYLGLALILLSVVLQTARVWLANRGNTPTNSAIKS
jgi:drug/metabolite transporter (DMT)-like permease